MDEAGVDKPFRITRRFLLVMAFISIPVAVYWQKWSLDLPWYSIVCGYVVFPFLLTLFVYCPVVFIYQVIHSGYRGRQDLKWFFCILLGVSAAIFVAYYFDYFEGVRPWLAFILTAIAIMILGSLQSRRR